MAKAKMRIKDPEYVQETLGYKGLTLTKFSNQVNISYSRLSEILNGKNTTKADTAHTIANALGFEIKDIFFADSVRKIETKAVKEGD
ncbi:helix-turn-helix domain-containing protein [Loigolactobacillus backii]|uniref:helix-turn-helix domain-containing protein n=1 Tax=Loigolactobacillus backii TaxID=375175 RepID=UPI0007F16FE0|nr:helix-turn-helix transcriptional regulator [Loigolactobacillus backii]ANK59852.1 hypothetical protein AYR52_06000 [Loigolactobacillus backii]